MRRLKRRLPNRFLIYEQGLRDENKFETGFGSNGRHFRRVERHRKIDRLGNGKARRENLRGGAKRRGVKKFS